MKNKRIPDRVHVVRTPEQDAPSDTEQRNMEVVRILAQISDKLKRSEAERYELLSEIREYRKSLRDLEDKAENSEKAYLALENKLKNSGNVDMEALQRQAQFEKALKNAEEKLVKSIAGQALIDRRLQASEEKQVGIDQRLDESLAEQTRISRQLELTMQDKSRILRKLESLEDNVAETRNALQAKAMVLLTDRSQSVIENLAAPEREKKNVEAPFLTDQSEKSGLSRFLNTQMVGMAAMIIAALLAGWTISQAQRPEIPQIAVLENGGIARLNLQDNRWEPVAQTMAGAPSSLPEPQRVSDKVAPESALPEPQADDAVTQDNDQPVTEFSDDQLLEALETDPEGLAADMNALEPGSNQSITDEQAPESLNASPELTQSAPPSAAAEKKTIETIDTPLRLNKTNPVEAEPQAASFFVENFEAVAFQQPESVQQAIMAEEETGSLKERIEPDSNLPSALQSLEAQAFAGNAEAQHDLAAFYTAGQAGVEQNFERAAFWFRQAANNGIANAQYNLGVLNHQGLGRERSLDKALYWYREAAKSDHAEAQYNLGIASIEGIGAPYNPQLAAAFFERSANNGIMEAAYNLGLIYENGLAGQTRPDEALVWYKIAADQGSPDARAAMESLATTLQIDLKDVDHFVARVQQINLQSTGRKMGPDSRNQGDARSVNPEQTLIAQVQEYLKLTGFYRGTADGIYGPRTQEAIKAYQKQNGLTVDGQVTKELLRTMVSGNS